MRKEGGKSTTFFMWCSMLCALIFLRDNSSLDKVFDYFSSKEAEDGTKEMVPQVKVEELSLSTPSCYAHMAPSFPNPRSPVTARYDPHMATCAM